MPVGPAKPLVVACGPRACGGGPYDDAPKLSFPGWSPRVRGWPLNDGQRCEERRVVPACGDGPPMSVPAQWSW